MKALEDVIIATLTANQNALISAVSSALQKYADSHYAVIAFEQHQDREEALLQAFLTSLQQPDHRAYLDYVVINAGLRSSEGYTLEEVQKALFFFEEAVWQTLMRAHPCDLELVEMLAYCTRIFTRGRDALAQIYLQKSMHTQNELDDLREKFQSYLNSSQTMPGLPGPVTNP